MAKEKSEGKRLFDISMGALLLAVVSAGLLTLPFLLIPRTKFIQIEVQTPVIEMDRTIDMVAKESDGRLSINTVLTDGENVSIIFKGEVRIEEERELYRKIAKATASIKTD